MAELANLIGRIDDISVSKGGCHAPAGLSTHPIDLFWPQLSAPKRRAVSTSFVGGLPLISCRGERKELGSSIESLRISKVCRCMHVGISVWVFGPTPTVREAWQQPRPLIGRRDRARGALHVMKAGFLSGWLQSGS